MDPINYFFNKKPLVLAGVEVLKNRPLIPVDEQGKFGMHNHLKDFGCAILGKRYKKDGTCMRM
jgi:hypothetical protein